MRNAVERSQIDRNERRSRDVEFQRVGDARVNEKFSNIIQSVVDQEFPIESDAATAGGFFDDKGEVFAGANDGDREGVYRNVHDYTRKVISQKQRNIAKLLDLKSANPADWSEDEMRQAVALIMKTQEDTTRGSNFITRIFNNLGPTDAIPMPTQKELLEARRELQGEK